MLVIPFQIGLVPLNISLSNFLSLESILARVTHHSLARLFQNFYITCSFHFVFFAKRNRFCPSLQIIRFSANNLSSEYAQTHTLSHPQSIYHYQMQSSHTCETSCIDISKWIIYVFPFFQKWKIWLKVAKICSNLERNALTTAKGKNTK